MAICTIQVCMIDYAGVSENIRRGRRHRTLNTSRLEKKKKSQHRLSAIRAVTPGYVILLP